MQCTSCTEEKLTLECPETVVNEQGSSPRSQCWVGRGNSGQERSGQDSLMPSALKPQNQVSESEIRFVRVRVPVQAAMGGSTESSWFVNQSVCGFDSICPGRMPVDSGNTRNLCIVNTSRGPPAVPPAASFPAPGRHLAVTSPRRYMCVLTLFGSQFIRQKAKKSARGALEGGRGTQPPAPHKQHGPRRAGFCRRRAAD